MRALLLRRLILPAVVLLSAAPALIPSELRRTPWISSASVSAMPVVTTLLIRKSPLASQAIQNGGPPDPPPPITWIEALAQQNAAGASWQVYAGPVLGCLVRNNRQWRRLP